MLIGGAFVFPLLYMLPIAAGTLYTSANGVPTSNPPQAIPLMEPLLSGVATLRPALQTVLLGAILAGFVAAMMSTADTLLLAAVYVLFYDFLAVPRNRPSISFDNRTPEEHASLILKARIWLLILALGSVAITVLGILNVGIGPIIWGLFSSLIILAVPLFMALLVPKFARGRWPSAYLSITIGFLSVFVYFGLTLWLSGSKGLDQAQQNAPVIALGIALLAYLIASPFKPGRVAEGDGHAG